MLTFILLVIFLALTAGIIWFFIHHDRGQKEAASTLWLAAGFGLVAFIVAGIFENLIIPAKYLEGHGPLGIIFLATMGVGVIEEALKFIPFALFIYKKNYFSEHIDGIIYFTIVGLSFGLPENILYTVGFGNKTGLVRLVMTPFFHAATAGMVGYFLAKHKISKTPLYTVVLALAGAILLHALYDFGLTSGRVILVVVSFMITLGMSVGLFVFYMLASEKDKDMGLTKDSSANFCQSCGAANSNHTLYCTTCGHRV
ncbi:MAG: PrsW family glutamic-type intramembrane protease [Candidatus Saccharimonadales bacterium]